MRPQIKPIETLDGYERVRITDATRILLCDLAAGDPQRPLRRLEADWEEVFQGVGRNGLLGLAHRHLEASAPGDYPPPEFRGWVRDAFRASTIRMMDLYGKIRWLLADLNGAGVETLVVKGPALAHTVYPDPALRTFNDLDLVVRERDWAAVHQLLLGLGFLPESDLPQPPPKLVPQGVLYELKYWHRDTGFLVEVHYDDILNAGLASRDVEGFWSRASSVDMDGLPVRVLSLADQLVHLCAHTHYHGYSRLNWFSDMALMVRDCAERLDWVQVQSTVMTEEAQVGAYYSLLFLEQMLGVAVPRDQLELLRPDRVRRWLHERYLPERKVLSFQPMARPSFSFYFTPFLRRLLPDLLVMGRRGDKLRYLVRLAVPSREWLVYYYGLDPAKPVWIHHILHPMKRVFRVLEELVKAVFRKRT